MANRTDNARRAGDDGRRVVLVANDKAAIEGVQDEIVRAVEREGYPKAASFAIRLALHEAMSNAFVHGHRGLPSTTPVKVEYHVGPRAVEIAVEDQGPGFEPEMVPDPTLDENLEVPSGRGLMLMRAYMTRVAYSRGGRRLELHYARPPEATPRAK